MIDQLMTIFCGTFTPPKVSRTVTHRCMTGKQVDRGQEKVLDDAMLATLRLLRDYRKTWFTSTEICKEMKIKLASKAYKPLLMSLVEDGFIHMKVMVAKNGNKKRVFMFNGDEK